MSSATSLDVKEAVRIATEHLAEVFGTGIGDVELEEVENVEDGWRITLSFERSAKGISPLIG